MVAAIILVLFILSVFCLLRWRQQLPKNVPPGPFPLPIVGNIFQMKRSLPHILLFKWTKEYRSSTVAFYVGPRLVVTMHDVDTVRKVFGQDNTTGRDQTHAIAEVAKGHGLIFSQGELWRSQRRFAISTLRDFGMGKSWLEDNILDEVEALCTVLENSGSKPTDIKYMLAHSVANVVSALIFGRRFPHTEKHFTELTKRIAEGLQRSDNTLYLMFPFLKYVPGHFKDDYKTMERFFSEICDFIRKLVDEHNHTFRPEEVNDYIDAFMSKGNSDVAGNNFDAYKDDEQLVWSVFNLLNAGTDTISMTSLWSVLYMIENPHILEEIRKEIDRKVPADQVLQISHRSSLPLTDAAIMEVQRMASVTPRALPHTNFEDIEIDGYHVPKNSVLQVNIHAIHHDPRYWENPEVFDPSRFLDENGNVFKPNAFIPFSAGKRSCLAESLAKQELFLFIGNLFRRFDFALPVGCNVSSKKTKGIFILSPEPFEVIISKRQHAIVA